jgi:hypothetical protein
VPRDASFNVDAAAVIAKISELGRCIIYLASPNNPTGNCLSKEDFLRICATDCVVVLDEAYAEFSQASLYDAAAPLDNVIFCRTFSKWAALAGMRVGYCIAHTTLVRTMMAIKQPYNIPVCSESAALAALAARAQIMEQVLAIVDEREAMVAQVTITPHTFRQDLCFDLRKYAVKTVHVSSSISIQCEFRSLSCDFLSRSRSGARSEGPWHIGPSPLSLPQPMLHGHNLAGSFFWAAGRQPGRLHPHQRGKGVGHRRLARRLAHLPAAATTQPFSGLMAALHDINAQVQSFRALLQHHAYDTLIFDM